MVKFFQLYRQLNKKQKEAVDAIEGPVMVIAGPGTGKTQILTLRIANILQKTDTPPGGILALTFTESGAKEMRRRLRELIGPEAGNVRIHTYHGFAASIISEFDDHFPHLFRAQQITDIEAEQLIREILKQKKFVKLRPFGDPNFYVGKIISAISNAKREAWTPEIIRAFAKNEIKRIQEDESLLSLRGATKGQLKAEALKRIEKCERTMIFADVYEAYEKSKRDQRKIDYDDLVVELLTVLRKDKLLLSLLQEKFLYILVDEHQDTNDSQNALIQMIADYFEMPNLFVVGDEKQAIYRFQGASVENFIRFRNIWKSMRIIPLKENYRSHQNILDASFLMIENNYGDGEYPDLRVRLKADLSRKSRLIDVVTAGNMAAGETHLVEEIKKTLADYPSNTIAVITRRNREAEKLLRLFEQYDIQASAERGIDVFSHPLGTLFFDLLDFLADPSQIESLARTMAGGLWDLRFDARMQLIREIRSGRYGQIEKLIPAILKLRKEMNQSGSIAYLTLAGELSGISHLAARDSLAAEVWRALISLASELAFRGNADDPMKLMSALKTYRASADTKSIKVSSGSPEARVRIMTAHGAKGLEFDYVFVPYATEESWIIKDHGNYFVLPREKDNSDDIRDMRRLFYVALTRARTHACLIIPLEDTPERPFAPLRFIGELDAKLISKIELPARAVLPATGKIVNSETADQRRSKEMIEYAKRSLLGHGLSVTALNHFCECPSKFLFKSILKLPEPPSANAEKGNAMHEAMARVWHLSDKNDLTVTKTIKKAVQDFMANSLLPIFEKEPILEELERHAPIVAKSLIGHFNQTGIVSTEAWVERVFSGNYQKKAIIINLRGKLDAILETKTAVSVYDYKTREALSVNAIKGETKNGNRDYFRQLVFYKILLDNNSKFKNKSIETALVFIKPDDKGRCPIISLPVQKSDLDSVKSEIESLINSVWSGKVLTDYCEDKNCEYCQLRRLIN